ncbi:Uncharacterised protein [Mycobacteroides abscessus subsp. abscessus]|nr:Uncharacterised protein [Mycobacteroides abscessus subsp. abscessus]
MMTIRSAQANPKTRPSTAHRPSTTARIAQHRATTSRIWPGEVALQTPSFIPSLNATYTTSRIEPRSTSIVGRRCRCTHSPIQRRTS